MPEVNYLAVLVAAIASMVVGSLWYSPLLFGKVWMHLAGMHEHDAKKGMGQAMMLQFIASLVTAYVLAHFMFYTNANMIVDGLQGAFWIWLGFVATSMMGDAIFAKKPWKLYFINSFHYLASLLVMGAIIAAWH